MPRLSLTDSPARRRLAATGVLIAMTASLAVTPAEARPAPTSVDGAESSRTDREAAPRHRDRPTEPGQERPGDPRPEPEPDPEPDPDTDPEPDPDDDPEPDPDDDPDPDPEPDPDGRR
jgi:hypothetical protein